MSRSFTSGVLESILHEQRISLEKVKELDLLSSISSGHYDQDQCCCLIRYIVTKFPKCKQRHHCVIT